MIQLIMDTLREIGTIGLFIGVGIEALSIPFPAAIVFLVYGYVMDPSGWEWLWLSLSASAAYTGVAFIPYMLSNKFHHLVERRVRNARSQRMIRFMEKYRGWTIAAGRILGMGYIVYAAAFYKISPLRYGFFTFIGVLPVALVMLYLGTLGNLEAVYMVFQNVQYLITGVLVALVGWYVYRRVKKAKQYREAGRPVYSREDAENKAALKEKDEGGG
ncbi:DedA family protein [Alkalicoccus urumqiensis]|uniref:DedA family protein n=1 Tax=Alkalicoccus urumqiensis TaxID=1548213 RepID=A0A2P6MJU7_ALKUR|nr:hypothetical protein [Alkalicoccus urumqiensis]PRO66538.1 hypothetical protein C6I21_04125 [Alkalicoccus urumqiensis]